MSINNALFEGSELDSKLKEFIISMLMNLPRKFDLAMPDTHTCESTKR